MYGVMRYGTKRLMLSDFAIFFVISGTIVDFGSSAVEAEFASRETGGQDYKEKHKLDSKQVSNSPC